MRHTFICQTKGYSKLDTARQFVLFPQLFEGKPAVARFDQENSSSDGGALLLKAVDEQLGLSRRVAACIEDRRQPGKIQQELEELLCQRLFGIACGYADTNDAGLERAAGRSE